MGDLENLKSRLARVMSEVKDIATEFEAELADPDKAVSFGQVKEIEASAERLQRQGLRVPEELKRLKIRLFSAYESHKQYLSLYEEFVSGIQGILSQETTKKFGRSPGLPRTGDCSYRKPANYERPLGSKGNSNVEDYLIPVIKLMWSGHDHSQAFRLIAKKLDVRYNTVSAQCTRALGLSTDEFVSHVKSKKIVDLIERKYSDQYHTINSQLRT